jgi:glutamate carboxypeptidase
VNALGASLGAALIALPLSSSLAACGGSPPVEGSSPLLNGVEEQLRDYVEQNHQEAIQLLQRVADINSGTMNLEGVRAVGRVFEAELDALGFETRWISMPREMGRAGHLFAERRGNRGSRILLIGHLDTVFENDSPFQKSTVERGRMEGPGTADMKGGDVAMLYALKALHHVGALDGSTITVALIGDEEKPGRPIDIARADLIEAAGRSDVALEFEGGVGRNDATLARRGAGTWILEVTGKEGHSSRVFSPTFGYGAIYEAARILNAFREELGGEEYLTFNPGVILGGTSIEFDPEAARGTAFGKPNVIPQTVTVQGELRFISERQKKAAQARMQAIVGKSLSGTSATIHFPEDEYPAMAPNQGDYELLAVFDDVSRDLGLGAIEPVDPASRGAADISFVAPLVDALAGLGPVGSGSHSTREEVDLESLRISSQRAAILLYRLTR